MRKILILLILFLCFASIGFSYTILDDETGGDCSNFGTWNDATNTCTMTQNINESVIINMSGVTIECDNYENTKEGSEGLFGFYVLKYNNVILKNCSGNKYMFGIVLRDSNNNQVINGQSTNNTNGAIRLWNSSSNHIYNINSSLNGNDGLNIYEGSNDNIIEKCSVKFINLGGVIKTNNNTIKNNTLSSGTKDATNGINIGGGENNIIEDNLLANIDDAYNTLTTMVINNGAKNNIIRRNTFQNNSVKAIKIDSANNNQIYYNRFISDIPFVEDNGINNTFNTTIGGNYWSDANTTNENADCFSDYNYIITSNGTDYRPFLVDYGWDNATCINLNNDFNNVNFSNENGIVFFFNTELSGNISQYVTLNNNFIEINDSRLNVSANITFYNLINFTNPIVYHNGVVVQNQSIYNLVYNSTTGIATFSVSSWSNYSLGNESITPPPSSVTELTASDVTNESIYWEWTNPTDLDFLHSEIYIDDVFLINTSDEFLNYSGLIPETNYTIKIWTIDTNGNLNNTDVTDTQSTLSNEEIQEKEEITQTKESNFAVFNGLEEVGSVVGNTITGLVFGIAPSIVGIGMIVGIIAIIGAVVILIVITLKRTNKK